MIHPLFSPEDSDLALKPYALAHPIKYIRIGHHYAHRLVLARMMERQLTAGEVCDHINGNPADNRRENLRLVTPSENMHNRNHWKGAYGTNFTGICKDGNRWRARLQFMPEGRKIVILHECTFATPEEAAFAYNQLAERYGFKTRNPISLEQLPIISTAKSVKRRNK